ncbi:MAG TPA: hypothetical protein VLC50_06915, partial [Actinomycetes bacterium]|nr:hypothetical protein [Actinomycetes bacterium]
MDRQHRARSVRTVRRAVGVLSVCLLLVAGLVWQGAVRQRPAQSGTVGTSQPATVSAIPSASATPTAAPTEGASAPRPSTTANGSAPSRAEERRAALTKLLDARSAAVAHRDVDAFLATVDPTAADYRTQQTTLFANLRRLDPVVWRYEYGGEHGEVPAGQSAKSGSVGYLVRVQLHYRLGPVDPVDVVRQQWVVARQHAGRWVLAGPGDDVGEGHESDVDAWDLGPVTVARGDASLVVARSGGGSGGPRVRPASSYVEEV